MGRDPYRKTIPLKRHSVLCNSQLTEPRKFQTNGSIPIAMLGGYKYNPAKAEPQQCLSCELCWKNNCELFVLQGLAHRALSNRGTHGRPITVSQHSHQKQLMVLTESDKGLCWESLPETSLGNSHESGFLDWVLYLGGPFKVSSLFHHSNISLSCGQHFAQKNNSIWFLT